ncbi:MAG: GNAT family N-acetyltransferase [Xanthobacteraceae bacterium]|nr:GNAT family N-acetyltransferase [Xanthobacteraceae bacterium]
MISATICSPHRDLAASWDDLSARAETNVFMHPAALLAAAETGFARIHVLQAWDEDVSPRRLVGFWALQERRALSLAPPFLESLPYNYAFTSNAVIDAACVDAVMAAFFEAIRRDARLPKVISLRSFAADTAAYDAILRLLAGAGQHREFLRVERPFADTANGVKKSGSTRKKLRQDWNRLCGEGAVEVVNAREPAAVEAAFETFLTMEAGSWKGDQGTALLCDVDDARFVRRLIGALAAGRQASVALLQVGGATVAAQVLLYSGTQAYTWKTAYDPGFGRFSPGALLVDKVTGSLLEGGDVTVIDSCSSAEGFMAQLWTGRRSMVDALVDVRSRASLAFAVEAARRQGFEQLRAMRDRMRQVLKRSGRPAAQKAS